MTKGQGLPITTVVLIVLAVAVLAVIIIFFLGGMGSSNSSINTFQCQQMCSTINTLVASNQVCDSSNVKDISTFKSFCAGKCNDKISCVISTRKTSCGWDVSLKTPNACVGCTSGNAFVSQC